MEACSLPCTGATDELCGGHEAIEVGKERVVAWDRIRMPKTLLGGGSRYPGIMSPPRLPWSVVVWVASWRTLSWLDPGSLECLMRNVRRGSFAWFAFIWDTASASSLLSVSTQVFVYSAAPTPAPNTHSSDKYVLDGCYVDVSETPLLSGPSFTVEKMSVEVSYR